MSTINEQIVTGRAHRVLIDKVAKLWQRISFWTKASDVEFNDGNTAETKVGAIKGITTDLNTTETGYAADMTALAQLNSDISVRYNDETGVIQIYRNGEWEDLPTGSFPNAPVDINITIPASYLNVTHKKCIKYGNVVHVFIYAGIVHANTNEFIATNLPKPIFQNFLPCFITDGYSMPTDTSSVLLNTNGTLSINVGQASKFTANKYFLLNTTYICS